MKKNIYLILLLSIFIFVGCDPVEDRTEPTGSITSEQLDADIRTEVIDGKNVNKVILDCYSPVLCHWSNGIVNAVGNHAELLMFTKGEQTVTLTGLCKDGTEITREYTVNVEDMHYSVPIEYSYLCGTGTKEWTWATAEPAFGNGGANYAGPGWYKASANDLTTQCSDNNLSADGAGAYMTFSLNGAKFIKHSTDGKEQTGTFALNLETVTHSKNTKSISINGDANILYGYDNNSSPQFQTWSEYEIVSIEPDRLVLAAQMHGKANYWYWVFVPKE